MKTTTYRARCSMNANYTSGPWTINHSFDSGIRREIWTESDASGHRELVALIPDAEGEHIDADARLIAAAPAMLEALRNIFNTAPYGDPDKWNAAVDKVALAIEQATGVSL